MKDLKIFIQQLVVNGVFCGCGMLADDLKKTAQTSEAIELAMDCSTFQVPAFVHFVCVTIVSLCGVRPSTVIHPM